MEWVDDEAVVLDPESGELHYLNGPAALIYALIAEQGYDGALAELGDRFTTEPDLKEQIDDVVKDMVEKGLLIDG